MYVYIRSEPGLYTVGHYTPEGKWVAESDFDNTTDAANRVAWLNGSRTSNSEIEQTLRATCEEVHVGLQYWIENYGDEGGRIVRLMKLLDAAIARARTKTA